jgi:hypothetical protein
LVAYEITAVVAPELAAAFEAYIRNRHIPDLLATGCFERATFATSGLGRYRARYEAPDRAALDRYLAEHAPRLRADVAAHFPKGLELSREVWDEVGTVVGF